MGKQYGMKRIIALLAAGMLTLTACGSDDVGSLAGTDKGVLGDGAQEDSWSGGQEDAGSGEAETVRDDGYEKFIQLEIGMTESEVNAILGEPVEVDKAYYTYNVTVNGKDMELTVWISMVTGEVIHLQGDFDKSDYREAFADSNTNLSAVNRLESGELDSYEACAEAFKTPGYLIYVDDDGVKEYLWVNTKGGYMRVTFRSDGTVKTYSGFC